MFCDTVRLKVLNGKSWNSPITHKFSGCPIFFWIIGGFSTNFLALRDKNNRQNRDTPIIQQILKPEQFWNTNGFAHDDFWRCETKKFDKIVIPFLSKNFWYQNISETQNGSPTMFSGDLGQKNFDGKTWHPLLIHIFFRTRKFLKHKSVPPRSFSVPWD